MTTEYTFGNALSLEELANRDKPFWTCPVTEYDCRNVEKPALAIIRGPERTCKFQMYSTWALADDASYVSIECQKGMTTDFILDNLFYHAKKSWIDHKTFIRVMSRIANRFNDKSWNGDCATSQNPLRSAMVSKVKL
ncbi:MAG: hypothetical protein HQL34_02365 [Alphaproteobacteria bacterium]|nr:hypothetical protein [Alphaproteobacteria bacterium]